MTALHSRRGLLALSAVPALPVDIALETDNVDARLAQFLREYVASELEMCAIEDERDVIWSSGSWEAASAQARRAALRDGIDRCHRRMHALRHAVASLPADTREGLRLRAEFVARGTDETYLVHSLLRDLGVTGDIT